MNLIARHQTMKSQMQGGNQYPQTSGTMGHQRNILSCSTTHKNAFGRHRLRYHLSFISPYIASDRCEQAAVYTL